MTMTLENTFDRPVRPPDWMFTAERENDPDQGLFLALGPALQDHGPGVVLGLDNHLQPGGGRGRAPQVIDVLQDLPGPGGSVPAAAM